MAEIRLARHDDLSVILAISNWAAKHTAANFSVEPETLESWRQDWRDTHEMYPWFVAVDKPNAVRMSTGLRTSRLATAGSTARSATQ